jgi:putative transposase
MDTFESLNHSVWDGKYHIVFIPKCGRRTLYEELRCKIGDVLASGPHVGLGGA